MDMRFFGPGAGDLLPKDAPAARAAQIVELAIKVLILRCVSGNKAAKEILAMRGNGQAMDASSYKAVFGGASR